jgi:hypothetical protein
MATVPGVWKRFRGFLEQRTPGATAHLRPPVTEAQLKAAEAQLGVALPKALRALYLLCDGFEKDQYLLRDDLRLLPLDELVARTVDSRGQARHAWAREHLVFAVTRPQDPDIEQVSLKLPAEKVEIWYRAGGVHEVKEVLSTGGSLSSWLDDCMGFYG